MLVQLLGMKCAWALFLGYDQQISDTLFAEACKVCLNNMVHFMFARTVQLLFVLAAVVSI